MSVFDKRAKEYDGWYDKNKGIYLSEIEAVKKALKPCGRGLEIGVGTGRFAAPLGIGEGVDISKNMLKKAAARGIKARTAPAEKLPYKSGVFDYAAIITTLCFVRDPLKAVNEAYRVLKKGGRLAVGIVDSESAMGKKYRERKKGFYKTTRFFSKKEIKSMMKRAGFSVVYTYRTLYGNVKNIKKPQKPLRGGNKGSFLVAYSVK